MADDENPQSGLGAGKIQSVVNEAVDFLSGQLRNATEDRGRPLSYEEIREIVDNFKSDPHQAVISYYHTAWEECGAAFEILSWEKERTHPMERLLVKHFVELLAPRGKPAEAGRTLSRRVIPGFLIALNHMMGPELFEQYEENCQQLVDRIRAAEGDAFTWDHVYADRTSQVLVNDVLVYVSRHFTDVAKRRAWFEDVIEGHTPADATGAESGWRLGDMEFHMLWGALFSDLRSAMDSEDGLASIQERYGGANCELLKLVFSAMDEDFEELVAEPDEDDEDYEEEDEEEYEEEAG